MYEKEKKNERKQANVHLCERGKKGDGKSRGQSKGGGQGHGRLEYNY